MSKNILIKEFKFGFDLGDPYGSSMSCLFAIADELWVRDVELPLEWKYSPGMANDPRQDTYEASVVLDFSDKLLLRAGHILDRYINILKKQGKDY